VNEASWIYLGQLTRALQQEGVAGARAGEFVAEIDSHLAETGADPVDEFGPPFELAAELARRPGSRRPGWIPPMWAMWIVGLLAALMLVVLVDTIETGMADSTVTVKAAGLAWIAVFYPAVMAFSYASTRRLSGRRWTALTGGGAALFIVGTALATVTAEAIAGDRVVARVPATLFWAVVAVVVPFVGYVLVKRNNPIRFPDHAKHLDRLKWGPFAGRPPVESQR
jgi:hypothetical protein